MNLLSNTRTAITNSILVVHFAFTFGANAGIDLGQAINIARGEVTNATAIETKLDNRDNDGPMFDVELVEHSGRVVWEVKIDTTTGQVMEVERDIEDNYGKRREYRTLLGEISRATIDFSDALAVVLERYPEWEAWKIELEMEHGRLVYEVSLRPGQDNGSRFRVRVDAITGHIYYDEGENGDDSSITLLDALFLGELAAIRGDAIKVEVEREHGRTYLEVEVAKRAGRSLTTVELDGSTGWVTSMTDDSPSRREGTRIRRELDKLQDARIDWLEALQIARGIVQSGRPVEMELEIEHRRLWYEVKFVSGREVIKVYVDARNGNTR